jgi:hypothetical protein
MAMRMEGSWGTVAVVDGGYYGEKIAVVSPGILAAS